MSFTLDASVLITMERRYPREFFLSLWEAMERAAENREVCICEVAYGELERGNDDLAPWAKEIEGFICGTTDDEILTVNLIARDHPGWVQGQKNNGDPFIIAHAKYEQRTVVTEEKRKGPGTEDRNQKIPNVADEHCVECVTFFEFMRAQRWRF
jgi:hypothetical protein